MTPEKLQEYMKVMQPLVDKLKEVGVAGYQLALRQVAVDAMGSILWLIGFVILLVLVLRGSRSWLASMKARYEAHYAERYGESDGSTVTYSKLFSSPWCSEEALGWAVVTGFGVLLAALGIGYNTYKVLAYAINPDWFAIMKIAELVKAVK